MEDKRTSVYIKDPVAREYVKRNNINLSERLTSALLDDIKQENEVKKERQTEVKISMFGSICFLFLGITLLVSAYAYTVATVFSLVNLFMVSLAVVSCVLIGFYVLIHVKIYRKARAV